MPIGFTFIDQYRSMAKDLEQSCDDVLNFDQEVPQSRHFLEEIDIKPEIKLEAADGPSDFYNMMECIMNHNNSNTTDTTANSSKTYLNFLGSSNHKNVFTSSTGSQVRLISASMIPPPSSAAITTAASKCFSSSSSPKVSTSTLQSLLPFSTTGSTLTMSSLSSNITTTKTSTFVTELAGSGCTVVSNPDFLLDTPSTMTPFDGHEDSREYIDLDKQPMSMYEDYGSFSNMSKSEALSDESNSVPLEEAVFMMTDTIQSDCDNLNVPHDPQTWSTEHLRRWVSWVCRSNDVPDVSPHLYQFDGRTLCSLAPGALSSSFGEAGIKISNELELLKAANSCFPKQIYGINVDDLAHSRHLCDPYLENHKTLSLNSCVSPAPSTCSSTHDSNTSIISTHSDHSDDESGYGSQISSHSVTSKFGEANGCNRISAKVPTGRGHKQTIHLWQFLKELLLSKDNNYSDCIRWLDHKTGIFKIEDSKRVANLWGARKNRPAMNYDKLSRSVRQYYKKGIIKKTEQSKRLVYQFCAGYM